MKNTVLIIVMAYMLIFAGALGWFGYCLLFGSPLPNSQYNVLFECMVAGGAGGAVYCFRGIYLSWCVRKDWADEWLVWYLLRPVVSLMCGVVGYVFLKAGLLVLQAKKETGTSNLGFLAFAFIAGMNVDKFIRKLEDLAKSTWGIEKSRAAGDDTEEKVKDPGKSV